jgi:thiol-disulfide isomerase/thioredoxin
MNIKRILAKLPINMVIALMFLVNTTQASDWTEVRTLEGKFTTLSQYFEKDKWTLVMLWTTDCGVCQREYPEISKFHDKHKDIDAKVLGVSLDGYSHLEKIKKHINEMPMTFENLIGEVTVVAFNYETATEEPLRGTPTFLMFNPQGQLVGHNPGPVKPEALEKFISRK